MYGSLIRFLALAGFIMLFSFPTRAQTDCPLAPRLMVGEWGQVVTGGANRLRSNPSADGSIIGEIEPGGIFEVRGTPTCADGYNWWPVSYEGLDGWTAEGVGGEYWLAPYVAVDPTESLPETTVSLGDNAILPANAAQLVQVGVLGNGIIIDIAWSPDGHWLAVATSIGLELYDTTSTQSGPRTLVDDFKINDVTFGPSGELVAAGNDGFVHAWDATTGEQSYQLRHDGAVLSVALSADGSRLVTFASELQISDDNRLSYSDPMLRLWDMETKAVIESLELSTHVEQLHFFDGQRVAFQEGEFVVSLWDTGSETTGVSAYGFIEGWSLHPDGQQVVIGSHLSADGGWVTDLVIVDVQTHDYKVELNIQDDFRIDTVAYNPAGDLLLTVGNAGDLRIRRADTLEVLMNLTDEAFTISFSSDGKLMAVGGRDGGIRLFSAPILNTTGQVYIEPRHVLFGIVGMVNQVEFSPDSRRVAAVGDDDTVRIWDIETGKALITYHGYGAPLVAIDVSSENRYVAAGTDDSTVLLWDVTQRGDPTKFDSNEGPISSSEDDLCMALGFSPAGTSLLIAGNRETQIKQVVTGLRLTKVEAGVGGFGVNSFPRSPGHAVFLNDQQILIEGTLYNAFPDGSLEPDNAVFDIPVATMYRNQPPTVALSRDRRILAISREATTAIYSAQTGNPLQNIQLQPNMYIHQNAVSGDGRVIALYADNNANVVMDLSIWNALTGELITQLSVESAPSTMALNADGSILFVGDSGGNIDIWGIAAGHTITTLHGHTEIVSDLVVTDDGEQLLSAGYDGVVRIWEIKE
jgi:WD40 repeat protein